MSDNIMAVAMGESSEEVVRLKPYYVYELVDSSSNEVFYVGKGTGKRAHAHALEANVSEQRSEKLERIREIIGQQKEVTVRVIGRYNTENEAFAVEATLIHWMYGYRNLTNVARGHGSSTIREKGDFDQLSGIDIPERRLGTRDGTYIQKFLADRTRYGVEEVMKRIKKHLEENSGLSFSPVDLSVARWTTIAIVKNGVKLVVGKHNSSSEEYWIEVQSLDGKGESKEKVNELCERSELQAKQGGAYAKLSGYGSRLKDPEKVLEHVQRYYREILMS